MTKKEKLIREYRKKLRFEIKNSDTEIAHGNADIWLCELLEKLGYKEVVDVYDKVEKWYA